MDVSLVSLAVSIAYSDASVQTSIDSIAQSFKAQSMPHFGRGSGLYMTQH